MSTVRFYPWRWQLASGLGLLAAGVAIAVIGSGHLLAMLAGISTALIGARLVGKAEVRQHGQRIERIALSGLSLPSGWTIEPNYRLKTGGDLDLLLSHLNGTRFAVEIKSQEGALLKRSSFGKSEELLRLNGKRFEKDPIEQVLNAASHVSAIPVIWFPNAKLASTFNLKCGVIVVQGDQHQLKHAIGSRRSWFRF